jgi:hypothetical protein
MLSYAEHGKFPATTQGRNPCARDEKVNSCTDPARIPAMVRNLQWTTGPAAVQWPIVAARRNPGYGLQNEFRQR